MSKIRILIVEDEGIVALSLQRTLEQLGYEVPGIAASGADAIHDTAEMQPDLVLMDILLDGEMDGIAAASHIQAHCKVPIVYLTAYADAKTLERAKLTEPFGYLLKPFGKQELQTTIEMALYKHQVEREREQFIAELEAKNAELERFTYTVSHDLKSPLVTIRGFLGFVEQDAMKGDLERLRADLEHIREATDTMHLLLNDLLELSRIGRVISPPEDMPFGELVQEALERVAGHIAERGVRVTLAPDVPTVHGDRRRLIEVVQNLLENAIKFMGDQREPMIEIGAKNGGDEIVFYVADNGIGIEPRYHEKVFGLFEQLEPSMDGKGVGLALVKQIVELHEGRIWVESEGQGAGSTFCFTLPDKNTLQNKII